MDILLVFAAVIVSFLVLCWVWDRISIHRKEDGTGYVLAWGLKLDLKAPKEPMPEFTKDIAEKSRASQPEVFLEKLRDDICPVCGDPLKSQYYGTYDQYTDHWCVNPKCKFKTLMEVLY